MTDYNNFFIKHDMEKKMDSITLERLVAEHATVAQQISTIRKRGIRDSAELDALYEKSEGFECEIARAQMEGHVLADLCLDYCYRNLGGSSYIEGFTSKRVHTRGVYDRLPQVQEFLSEVQRYIGQRLLISTGDTELGMGVIAGKGVFSVDKSFRNLSVPVRHWHMFTGEETAWKESSAPEVWITSDIFKYPAALLRGAAWRTDYSKEIYVGGGPPPETNLCLGNASVSLALEDTLGGMVRVPERRVKIPPLYFL